MNVFDKKIFNDCAGFGITETPSFYLTVVPVAGTETLFGKQVSELQTGVATNTGEIVGTLNYVLGYTGFSGKKAEQSGHYLALKATAQAGTVIQAKLDGGSGKVVTLDEDGMIVFRVTSTTQKVQFMATKDGETYTMTLPLTNVVLAPLNFNLQVVPATDTDGAVGGKYASDLQEDVVFGERATGTLKYVSGYASFAGDNQNGNFLLLKATAIQDATITAEVLFYSGEGSQVVYGTDGLIVCRLESNSEEIAITATLDGQTTTQRISLYFEYEQEPIPSGLTPFVVNDVVNEVQFNGGMTDEQINAAVLAAYSGELSPGASVLSITVEGQGEMSLLYAMNGGDVEQPSGIMYVIGTSMVVWSNFASGSVTVGYQESWSANGFSWDKSTHILTAPVSATITTVNSDLNGTLYGKVTE